jgi:hypothetical protein
MSPNKLQILMFQHKFALKCFNLPINATTVIVLLFIMSAPKNNLFRPDGVARNDKKLIELPLRIRQETVDGSRSKPTLCRKGVYTCARRAPRGLHLFF